MSIEYIASDSGDYLASGWYVLDEQGIVLSGPYYSRITAQYAAGRDPDETPDEA